MNKSTLEERKETVTAISKAFNGRIELMNELIKDIENIGVENEDFDSLFVGKVLLFEATVKEIDSE